MYAQMDISNTVQQSKHFKKSLQGEKNEQNNLKLRKKHINMPAQNNKTKAKSTQNWKQIALKQKEFSKQKKL